MSAEQIEHFAFGAASSISGVLDGPYQPLGCALAVTLETLGTIAAQLILRMDESETKLATACCVDCPHPAHSCDDAPDGCMYCERARP